MFLQVFWVVGSVTVLWYECLPTCFYDFIFIDYIDYIVYVNDTSFLLRCGNNSSCLNINLEWN